MDADRFRRRIESHVANGRFDAALAAAAAWCERSPALLEPELTHARVELAADRYRAAHARATAAIRARECPPALALEVVNCLRLLVAHDALFDFVAGYACWNDVAPADRARVAGALSTIGAMALARGLADSAVAAAPDDAVCRVNRALISSYEGDLERARVDLEHAIAGVQNPAMAHWLLARLARQTAQSNHVERLRRQLVAAGADEAYKEYLHFALFKELDDLGDTESAWAALEQGCAAVRRRLPCEHAEREHLFAAIKRQFAAPPRATGSTVATQPRPIFIVGMHRSGTTLLESMLAAHPDVHAYGESQRLSGALRHAADHYCHALLDERLVAQADALDWSDVACRYLQEGRRTVGGARFVTEKMPGNFQLVGFVRHALPQAKVIHLRRDPMDVCFANLSELFADGVNHSYALADLARFHAGYTDLMRHWHRVYPGFVLDVHYEELVADPAVVSRRVFRFCGLEWRPDVIEPAQWTARNINTLSSVQARQRVSGASVGRWKRYSRWLEPLRRELAAQGSDPASV